MIPIPKPYNMIYTAFDVTSSTRRIPIRIVITINNAIPIRRHFFAPYLYTLCPNVLRDIARVNTTIISIIP